MPSSSAVLATIPVGMEPRQVTVAPDGKRAYVSLSDLSPSPPLGAVGVIDTGSNTLLATVAVGILPGGVVVAPDGRHAYVPNIQHGGVVRSHALQGVEELLHGPRFADHTQFGHLRAGD